MPPMPGIPAIPPVGFGAGRPPDGLGIPFIPEGMPLGTCGERARMPPWLIPGMPPAAPEGFGIPLDAVLFACGWRAKRLAFDVEVTIGGPSPSGPWASRPAKLATAVGIGAASASRRRLGM